MRLLSLKVFLLIAPFAAMSVPAVVDTVTAMVRAERSVTFREGVFDPQLDGKWQALVTDDIGVIVAGDSRAERQVVPAIIERRTGLPSANVATNAGDLVTLSHAVQRHGLPAAARILIVSTSLFQINDGAIDAGYMSTACLLNMTSWERARVYADRLGSPWSPLAFSFVDGPPATIAPALLRERGFVGTDKQLSLPLPKVLLNAHPWYRRVSLHGARWRIFQEALGRLSASGVRVYVVLPPISPAWRSYTAGTFVDAAEREFAGMLASATALYSNVRFVDLYSAPDPRLSNDKFYDIQHLNRDGAAMLTDTLADLIVEERPLPDLHPVEK